ncbi:MAG: polysulfide reductase NrfD [Phycisphaerales bacterium]|nr:polysulfide reductase NrfD [Phycisphaerales bacterium]
MQYGFVINHEDCIGCHACTVACKAENEVPVGSFRTSVKYTEQGLFPDIRRMFLVQRCNHCTDAPCVTICPVNALDKRKDGIVDLDRDACIGCRACMQACPYDAIYLNEDLGAVEKCHYCAHRVEKNLEPACVNVCPVGAIVSGDMDDPGSRISLMILNRETKVRRPEQGTGPNVRYIGASDVALKPGSAERPETYIWSDRPPHKLDPWPGSVPTTPNARTVLDAGHKVEWGWPVALYLVTKGIAAGAGILAPFSQFLGLEFGSWAQRYMPEVVALLFTAITCFLLVEDLAKPWAFYRMVTRPNWTSWLVKGGVILGLYMVTTPLAIVLRLVEVDAAADIVRWINVPIALAVAGYTAFLFAQCKGRDLWESKWLLPHLLAQAVMLGSAAFIAFTQDAWTWLGRIEPVAAIVLLASLVAHTLFSINERYGSHATDNARQAAGFLGVVRLGPLGCFRGGLIIGVALAALVALLLPGAVIIPILLGLYLYEYAFIRAGQLPPLS